MDRAPQKAPLTPATTDAPPTIESAKCRRLRKAITAFEKLMKKADVAHENVQRAEEVARKTMIMAREAAEKAQVAIKKADEAAEQHRVAKEEAINALREVEKDQMEKDVRARTSDISGSDDLTTASAAAASAVSNKMPDQPESKKRIRSEVLFPTLTTSPQLQFDSSSKKVRTANPPDETTMKIRNWISSFNEIR